MKKVAVYVRVSTQEQAKEGFSIAAQKDKLTSYCIAKNWDIHNIYIDDGYTGTNLERPALKKLLKELNQVNIVLVYKLDRLSRSQKDVLHLVEDKFLKTQVDFVSLLESFDTTTPFGRAMVGILAVFAQLERDTIVERSKLGKERRAKEGKWRGGPVPLGYNYINGELRVNEYEANIIRKIFNMYVNGAGMDSISKNLNEKGYRSKQNARFKASKIKTYLTNPIYAGLTPYKDEIFQGNHKSIIDKETFELTKAIMTERKISYRKASDAPLGGLLICGECGAKMFRRKVKNYYYYTCYSYHGSPSHMITNYNCNLGYINSLKLESEIISKLHYCENDKNILNSLIEDILKSSKSDAIEASLDDLKEELSNVKSELSRWYDAYGKGQMDYDEVNNRIKLSSIKKKNIEDQISSILQTYDEISTATVNSNKLNKITQDLTFILKISNLLEKKAIFKGFIESIVVYKYKPPIIKFRNR